MIGTTAALCVCIVQLIRLDDGLIHSPEDRKNSIEGLRKIGFSGAEIIRYFEGHLDVIDEKNQSMLGFSANYLAVVGGSFYLSKIDLGTTFSSYLLYATLLCIALALVISFWNVNRVVWQEYHWRSYQWALTDISGAAETEMLATDLINAVRSRTRALRVSRLFYILSFGLAVDTILVSQLARFIK